MKVGGFAGSERIRDPRSTANESSFFCAYDGRHPNRPKPPYPGLRSSVYTCFGRLHVAALVFAAATIVLGRLCRLPEDTAVAMGHRLARIRRLDSGGLPAEFQLAVCIWTSPLAKAGERHLSGQRRIAGGR